MFFIVKGRNFLVILGVMCLVCSIMIMSNYKTEYVSAGNQKPKYTVVIDAGHGGIDGGSSGINTNTKESDLNLLYAKTLSKYLKNAGFGVVMTRTTQDGLYNTSAKNLKKSDMKKRQQIIEQSGANCVVSIHMNSYKLPKIKGAQVFYKQNNTLGKTLADNIQSQFIQSLPNAKQSSASGDYFMVNCTTLPAVIVECGFLSNPEEEQLLVTKDYRNKVCYLIMSGILNFFNQNTF